MRHAYKLITRSEEQMVGSALSSVEGLGTQLPSRVLEVVGHGKNNIHVCQWGWLSAFRAP